MEILKTNQKLKIFFIIAFFLSVLYCTQSSNQNQSQNKVLNQIQAVQPKYDSCNQDSDCVLVDKSCCGCSAGGASIAVSISEKDTYTQALKSHCKEKHPEGQRCLGWYRCETFKARCIQSQCIAEEI